jgi:ATP-dependent Zn protease
MTVTHNTNTTGASAAAQQAYPVDDILRRLATRSMGLTGADIERVVREARLTARCGKRTIRFEDIEDGIRSNRPPVPIDLRYRFSIHEAGHAVVHHALDLGPVRSLNIDTGQGAYNLLGFHPSGTDTRAWFESMLAMLMAGRAAEALVLKRVSSGSGGTDDSDLARATRIAFDMERTLGFGTEHPLLYRPHRDPAEVFGLNRNWPHAFMQGWKRHSTGRRRSSGGAGRSSMTWQRRCSMRRQWMRWRCCKS